MPFNSETARAAGKIGGPLAAKAKVENKRKLESHLLWLAERGSDDFFEKMQTLSKGSDLTKPEKEFMVHFKDLMEYHTPKLSRSELTGKDGKDLPQPILFNALPGNNSDSQGKRDEGKN